jgi:hypothetical protein
MLNKTAKKRGREGEGAACRIDTLKYDRTLLIKQSMIHLLKPNT